MEKELIAEIKYVIDWLEGSKPDFRGETSTNALFLIAHLKKVVENQ